MAFAEIPVLLMRNQKADIQPCKSLQTLLKTSHTYFVLHIVTPNIKCNHHITKLSEPYNLNLQQSRAPYMAICLRSRYHTTECIITSICIRTIRTNFIHIFALTHTPTQHSYVSLPLHQVERTTKIISIPSKSLCE